MDPLLILGLVVIGLVFISTLHPRSRRGYRYHYGRARRYASERYGGYRGRRY